ncbi:MAG: hypothetical protein JNM14_01570 [Ferruginibacter sp.]|nr:hypothetical protein [Ferruginibacter sp.]
MKKLVLFTLSVCCLFAISNNANAQLLKKLKEKAGATTSQNASANDAGSQEPGAAEEDKVKNAGKSYTINTSYGDVKYDIDKSAEMIAESKSADGTTQHFLTTYEKNKGRREYGV